MAKITSNIGLEPYRIEITSPTGNVIIADEPIANGGRNTGFSPKELLASALAACTDATLRMYADRKGWNLTGVKTDVELESDEAGTKTIITRKIEFSGNISEEQRARLISIAERCPVHKILSNPIEINTIA